MIVSSTGHVGGAEKILITFLKSADTSIFRFSAVIPSQGRFCELLKRANIPYEVSSGLYKRKFVTKDDTVFARPRVTLNSMISLLEHSRGLSGHIKKNDIDLVVCNGVKSDISGGIAAMRNNKACVWIVQDILPNNLYRRLFFLCALILARRIIVISESIKDTFPRYLEKRVELVYPFLDKDELCKNTESRAAARRRLDIKDDEIVLGTVGKLFPSKGIDIFLKAFSEVKKSEKNIRAVIAGDAELEVADPSYVGELKNLTRSLGVSSSVTFLGWQDDVYDLLEAMDILVYPPVRPHGFGRILIEAMSRSKAVIAFAHADTREIIDNHISGILVAPMDERGLAEELKSLVRDEGRIGVLGDGARKKVIERFGEALSKKRFDEILKTT